MENGKKPNNLFTALGAAMGLGNALRFPSLCAQHGGAFVLAYVLSLVIVCFPLLCAELHLGKAYAQSLDKTLRSVAPKLDWLAYTAAINSAIIALYYGVICARIGGAFIGCASVGEVKKASGFWLFALGALSLFAVWLVLSGKPARMSRTGAVSVVGSLSLFAVLAVAALLRGGRLSYVFSFDLACFAHGGLWADALGQALLALSLASGAMPTFARSFGDGFSPVRAAASIIAANLSGCMLAAISVLALPAPVPEGGGITVALTLYPRVIAGVFTNAVGCRIFSCAFFGVLWLVAVQSTCSLFSPLLGLAGEERRPRAAAAACALGCALLPVFAAGGCSVMNAVDRMVCSVNAVIIALLEAVLFNSPRNMPRLTRDCGKITALFIRLFCPVCCGALALFSVCGARFSPFPKYAVACAACAFLVAFAPLFVKLGKVAKVKLWHIKSQISMTIL